MARSAGNGHTKCPHCISTVRVVGWEIKYHVKESWSYKACPGFKTQAHWVEAKPLLAMARNSKGECMKCFGKNSEACDQCTLHWAREHTNIEFNPNFKEEKNLE